MWFGFQVPNAWPSSGFRSSVVAGVVGVAVVLVVVILVAAAGIIVSRRSSVVVGVALVVVVLVLRLVRAHFVVVVVAGVIVISVVAVITAIDVAVFAVIARFNSLRSNAGFGSPVFTNIPIPRMTQERTAARSERTSK